MQQRNCLNLCEILPYLQKKFTLEEILIHAMDIAEMKICERIYVGTYFCEKYFLQQSNSSLKELFCLCQDKNIKVTLVIPVFSEGDLETGKERIHQILEYGRNVIDELTINDYGMLIYAKQTFGLILNIGRLFMKDYRDPRYEEYFQILWKPKMFTNYFNKILKEFHIHSCELDITHKCMILSDIPSDMICGIHIPYCYQTMGRICAYASISKEISKKFRPNDFCKESCIESIVKYTVTDENINYLRFGRTIYFKHPEYELKGSENYRIIYFPIDL